MQASLPEVANATICPTEDQDHRLRLQYLPPITFTASLSPAYPLDDPPQVWMEADWLPLEMRTSLLKRIERCMPLQIDTRKLTDRQHFPVWQNDSSIYIMVDEVQVAIAEEASTSPLALSDLYTYEPATNRQRRSLAQTLVKHDRLMRHSTFSTDSFDCGICLETKKGARCTRLKNCGHVFCVECLYSYFELNIREGLVKNVGCADMECVKQNQKQDAKSKSGTVDVDEVEEIVGKDLKDRYVWLLEKQKIESGASFLALFLVKRGSSDP